MRQQIGQRQGEVTPRGQVRNRADSPIAENFVRSLVELVSEADLNLTRATSSHEVLQTDLQHMLVDYQEVHLSTLLY
jgi:hypothetical protein